MRAKKINVFCQSCIQNTPNIEVKGSFDLDILYIYMLHLTILSGIDSHTKWICFHISVFEVCIPLCSPKGLQVSKNGIKVSIYLWIDCLQTHCEFQYLNRQKTMLPKIIVYLKTNKKKSYEKQRCNYWYSLFYDWIVIKSCHNFLWHYDNVHVDSTDLRPLIILFFLSNRASFYFYVFLAIQGV